MTCVAIPTSPPPTSVLPVDDTSSYYNVWEPVEGHGNELINTEVMQTRNKELPARRWLQHLTWRRDEGACLASHGGHPSQDNNSVG